ncbi:MAG: glycosyltransferase family 4 protein, partial [Phycisphaerae bacterium]
MHILYLHQYFATPHGRTGTRSYEFARRWVVAGHRVTMLTSLAQLTEADLPDAATRDKQRPVTRLVIDGIDVVALQVPYHQTMGGVRRVWSFVRFMLACTWRVLCMRSVDVVYATSTPLTIGIPPLLARWLRGRRYVFEVRDVWPAVPAALGVIRSRPVLWAARRLERAIYRGADAIVTLSDGMAELVRGVAGGGKRIVTVPNCADTELFRPDIDGTDERRRRGWDGKFVCLHAGAMGRVNGLDSIVRAAEQFRDDPAFLFGLIGEGRERSRLEARRDRLGLGNLRILDGVAKRTLPAVLAAADVCLMTITPVEILEHNSANKLFDYLSAGRPVVLNYGGWQRRVLESAGAGVGCTLGDDQAFFDHLQQLKDDPSRRQAMGRAARTLAVEKYNRDDLAAAALR